jgi:hypothetical protein
MSRVTELAEKYGITSNRNGNIEMFAGQLYSDGYNNRKLDNAALRDHFAGLAMQGVLAMDDDIDYKYISSVAYIMADAMLAERSKSNATNGA